MKNKSTPWPPNQYIPLAHTVQNVRDIYIFPADFKISMEE